MHEARDEVTALNNAEWCAAVWRSHGLPVETAHGLWFCPRSTPQYYPNVVTVDRGADPVEQARFIIELWRGAPDLDLSVKDSFACLELSGAGLKPLFDARWLWRDPSSGPPVDDGVLDWRKIEDEPGLAEWERAWRGGEVNAERIFRSHLLQGPQASVLAGCDAAGDIRAGGVAYEAAGVLGVTNVFGSRRRFLSALGVLAPGMPVVAYEAGEDLTSAGRNGFETLGPLRVWAPA